MNLKNVDNLHTGQGRLYTEAQEAITKILFRVLAMLNMTKLETSLAYFQ